MILLGSITYFAKWLNRTSGTIQLKLMGVRCYNLVEGLKDLLKDKVRL